MATIYNRKRETQNFHLEDDSGWMPTLLFVGSVSLIILFLWIFRDELRPPTERPENTVAQRTPEEKSAIDTQKPRSLGLTNSRIMLGQHQPALTSEHERAERQHASPAQPAESIQNVQELDALLAQLKGTQTLTPEIAKDMKQLLKELRKQGVAVVPAIRAFLRSKEDVNFDKMKGGEQAEYHTLRQALFDTLRQIGGNEAIAVMLEQLGGNEDPAEIAMLARNLEEAAPGVYRGEALQAANNALQLWARGKEVVEVRPLFELLRDLGGVEAASILDQFPANANTLQYLRNKDTSISPTVRTYALISLASLPNGEGIPRLAALAGDPTVPVQNKPEMPFQMLSQASVDFPEARKALVELAQAKQIPDRAWSGIGDALTGKHLQFPSQMSGGLLPGTNEADVSGVEAPFVRGFYDDDHHIKYEERSVAADWSAQQVQQQLALIDKLLKVTTSPIGVKELQQARVTLQGSRL